MSLALLLVVGLGCVSINTYQSGRTQGRGNVEVVLEPQWVTQPQLESPAALTSIRYGLTDRLDLGVRSPLMRPTLTAARALRAPADRGVAVALHGEASIWALDFIPTDTDPILMTSGLDPMARLAMVTSIPAGRSELTVGVQGLCWPSLADEDTRLRHQYGYTPRPPGIAYGLGGSVGWSFPVGGVLRLHPEVSYVQHLTPYHFTVQAGLGVGLGSRGRGSMLR